MTVNQGVDVTAKAAGATGPAAGTWTLGDLTVNRIGFGAMRLTGGAAFTGRPEPRPRRRP